MLMGNVDTHTHMDITLLYYKVESELVLGFCDGFGCRALIDIYLYYLLRSKWTRGLTHTLVGNVEKHT